MLDGWESGDDQRAKGTDGSDRNTKNLGFAAAVNQGIRKAQGEYVALLNNDVEVDDNWLGNLCKAMSRRKNTFAVSSKMLRVL